MKKDLTELVFILDRSGSMSGLEHDTIGGYNSFLKKQQAQPGACLVTTVLFDDKYELLHDRVSLSGITPMTEHNYFPRGCTALLDAVGRTIDKIGNEQSQVPEEERPEKTLFVITTDGLENVSREYTLGQVRGMVAGKQKTGWEFLFLGADIDAVSVAGGMGIPPRNAARIVKDSIGLGLQFDTLAEATCCYRAEENLSCAWKGKLEDDFEKRGN